MSRPQFDVTTLLFLPLLHFCVATSIRCCDIISFVSLFNLWPRLLFQVVTSFSCLELQAGHDSNLLVCLFSCCDVDIRPRPNSFFNHCNSCRDLKSMSRPFFSSYPVATSFLSLNNFHSISYFWSRPDCSSL